MINELLIVNLLFKLNDFFLLLIPYLSHFICVTRVCIFQEQKMHQQKFETTATYYIN